MKTLEERLASYRAAFLEKVKRTNWNDEDECIYKRRGRKPQARVRIETKPRNKSELIAAKQKHYNWL